MVLLIVAGVVVALLVLVVTAALLFRFVVLRRGGTAALVRSLPARDGNGWRHGLIRYGEHSLVFYKLSSLRFGPDVRIDRQAIAVPSRRGPRASEFDIMSRETVVLVVGNDDRNYEFAFDGGALTAFLSWVESRPSGRSVRGRLD